MEVKEKVEVTEEQFHALGYLFDTHNGDNTAVILEFFGQDGTADYRGFKSVELKCLNDLTDTEFVDAVLHGYVIKRTPEQKVMDLYEYYKEEANSGDYGRAPGGAVGMRAIRQVLKALGMEVKGING